jgi:uncharacterized protein DUF4190
MICPHCGFDNPEGRKYCRGCTKPLAPEPAVATAFPPVQPLLVVPAPAPALDAPKVNRLALASFGLSMLGFIPPIGIASIVMGHISRKQIAASGGRETGNGYAFTALLLSYGQLFLVALIFCLAVVILHELNLKMNGDQYFRAALLERIMNGDPNHPSGSQASQQPENALAALRLIEGRQESFHLEHPQGNAYGCHINELTPGDRDDEVWIRIRAANYSVQVTCRMKVSNGVAWADGWQAMAYPRAIGTSEPIYCLDETKVIRRYMDQNALGTLTPYAAQSCPENGIPVE